MNINRAFGSMMPIFYGMDGYDFALGYQKIVWGQADDLRVVDVINPRLKDFVPLILTNIESVLPARLETSIASWDWQGLIVFDPEPNQLLPRQ